MSGYAVSLVKSLGGFRYIAALALVIRTGNHFEIRVLSPPSESDAHVMVVLAHRPGKFESAERDETVRTKWHLVEYAAMEAGSIGYYWKNGKFAQIQLSE